MDALCPARHVGDVVRFVDDAEYDARVRGVVFCELGPEAGELLVGGAALADYAAVPAGVVVDVDYAVCARGEAGLHFVVVGFEVCGVEGPAKGVVDEVLPGDVESEDVEVVVADEVLHLARSVFGYIDRGEVAATVWDAAEVHTGDVDASELDAGDVGVRGQWWCWCCRSWR